MDRCNCCSKHVPLPLDFVPLDTPSEVVYLCPTAMSNLNHLLARYAAAGGKPGGSVTKHYGKMVRDLADVMFSQTK